MPTVLWDTPGDPSPRANTPINPCTLVGIRFEVALGSATAQLYCDGYYIHEDGRIDQSQVLCYLERLGGRYMQPTWARTLISVEDFRPIYEEYVRTGLRQEGRASTRYRDIEIIVDMRFNKTTKKWSCTTLNITPQQVARSNDYKHALAIVRQKVASRLDLEKIDDLERLGAEKQIRIRTQVCKVRIWHDGQQWHVAYPAVPPHKHVAHHADKRKALAILRTWLKNRVRTPSDIL